MKAEPENEGIEHGDDEVAIQEMDEDVKAEAENMDNNNENNYDNGEFNLFCIFYFFLKKRKDWNYRDKQNKDTQKKKCKPLIKKKNK